MKATVLCLLLLDSAGGRGRGQPARAITVFQPTPTQIIFVSEFSQKIVELTGIFQILPKNYYFPKNLKIQGN